MKYALISDIHGNLDALNAVFADAKKQNVDQYIFLGDYFSEVHCHNEVIDKIKSIKGAYVIKGNREETLTTISNEQLGEWSQFDQMKAFVWCYNTFTPENRQYIVDMPSTLQISRDTTLHLAHSPETFAGRDMVNITNSQACTEMLSKVKDTGKRYADCIEDEFLKNTGLLESVADLPSSIYIFGHTHTQWHSWFGGNLLINPGAVANNKDFLHGGHYSILDIEKCKASVDERIIPYNVNNTVLDLRASDMYKFAPVWCEIVTEMLLTDKNKFESFLQQQL